MGMSNDYKEAIICGATNVRIGSLIFGERESIIIMKKVYYLGKDSSIYESLENIQKLKKIFLLKELII